LKESLGNSDFDEVKLLSKLRAALRAVRVSYPEAQFGFLAAIYGNPKLYSRLFRVMDGSSHLGPVKKYQAIGMGGGIASFLASKLYTPSMCIAEAARLGVFILSQVKQQTEGCDGPTSLVTVGEIGNNYPGFRLWSRDEINSIEAEISGEKFRDGLAKFWRENNPLPTFTPMNATEGGSAHWTSTVKLNTQP
jgi:hypothetical protein